MCIVGFEMKTLNISALLISTIFSSYLFAGQPLDSGEKSTIASYTSLEMSEMDMDDVSAVSGLNILNIHGAPAGGLMHENEEPVVLGEELNEWGFSEEAENTQEVANQEIDKIENNAVNENTPVELVETPTVIENSEFQGEAQNFTTSSEITYQKQNFNHEMTKLDNGSISISRDLYIDSLKIENLRGAHYDESRSAGSIYLSDWQSRGDTTITPR